MPPGRGSLAVAVVASALGLVRAAASGGGGNARPNGPLLDFMRQSVGVSDAQLTELAEGGVIVQRLEPAVPYEVAIFGAVRIGAPQDRVVWRLRDVTRGRGGGSAIAVGRFSQPPSLEDVGALRLDRADLAALARCGSGRCSSKLAALAPLEFATTDWSAPDVRTRAEQLVRAGLVRYVASYLVRGDAALMEYRDVRHPTSLAREFADLVRSSPYLRAYAPDLQAYLLRFPRGAPAGSESFVYWAQETFGFKPVLGAYHVIVHTLADPPAHSVVVTKQVYASRYFDTSLELAAVADASAPGLPASYLVYIARSRVDSLRGAFGRFKRGAVERESMEGTHRWLDRTRRALESP